MLARALLLLAAALAAAPAAASQYPLDQAAAIVAEKDAPRLRRAGVRATGDFLVWGRTAEGRRLLAQRSGFPLAQVTAWVQLADLMRVRGIGPDVARLLAGVGVHGVADLRTAEPAPLAATVRDFNRRTHLSSNPPGAPSIRHWVQQARALPDLVEPDP
jgi:hypothetical protein